MGDHPAEGIGPNACKKSSRGANSRPIATAAELA